MAGENQDKDINALKGLFGELPSDEEEKRETADGGWGDLMDEIKKEDLPGPTREADVYPQTPRAKEEEPTEEEVVELEEEGKSFEDELMPFLEMGIAEEEEETERELVREREEGISAEGPELEEGVKEEVKKEEVIERKVLAKPKPSMEKRFPIAASIIIPLFLIAGGASLLTLRIISSKDHLNRGIGYIKEGNFDASEVEFKEGIRRKLFGSLNEYNRYGLAYLNRGKYQQAEEKFNYVLKREPKNSKAHHNLMRLALARGDDAGVRKIATRILRGIDPKDEEAFLILGRLSMKEGKLTEASSYLNKALKLAPKNVEILRTLQRIFMAQADYDKALGLHRYMVERVAKDKATIDPGILTKLGNVYLDRKRSDLAEELFRVVLTYYPNFLEARYGLAEVFFKNGWLNKAANELNIIIKSNPHSAQAKGLMGDILYRQVRFEEAGRFLEEAVALQPQNPENHYRMGNLYYATGRMKEAIEAYERSGRLGFKSRDMSYNLGVAHYEEKDYEMAVSCWMELLEEEGDNPILNYSLANAYAQLLKWSEAREGYERAITGYHRKLEAAQMTGISPGLEDSLCLELGRVYNNIGVVYEELRMENEALRAYTNALEYASWGRGEDRIAYQNLNRAFVDGSIRTVSEAIHTRLRHNYLEG